MGDLGDLSRRISQLRTEDQPPPLLLEDLDPDPFVEFAAWLELALAAHPGWPNAMALATAAADGEPSVRTVLLKGLDGRGFLFFTNHESRKGRQLAENPRAAAVFYWPGLERQVCVRGSVERLTDQESDAYFATRPHGSRVGAWASPQSAEIGSREELDQRAEQVRARFGGEVPRPEFWGGYRLVPQAFEFWQSHVDRLHDRFLYERTDDGWRRSRLAP